MRIQTVDVLSRESEQLVSPGRAVMRRNYDGQLISTVVHRGYGLSALYYTESPNDGRTWTLELLTQLTDGSDGFEFNASIDSNSYGKYIAYSIPSGGGVVGQVAFKEIGATAFSVSGVDVPLTPTSSSVTKSFVAASRGQDEFGNFYRDVGYGWVDDGAGQIFVGHSDTGIEFPPAKLIHSDPDLVGGVSVATSGNFMLVVFQTKSALYRPVGLPEASTAFPAWMESSDGGETWSVPKALFGNSIDSFPQLPNDRGFVLAGGASTHDIAMNSLAWERPEKAEKNIYVTSAMRPISQSEAGTLSSLESVDTQIGIVSVRDFNISDSPWRHVVTHRFQSAQAGEAETIDFVSGIQRSLSKPNFTIGLDAAVAFSGSASLHQYSALPYTPVRTVTYLERTNEDASLVIVMSTDSGLNYDQFVRVGLRDVGIADFEKVRFSVSQCLFGGPNGDLFADAVLSDPTSESGLIHLKIPLGVNKKALLG